MEERQEKIREEIISTEESYVSYLDAVTRLFLEPLQKSSESAKPILSSKDIDIIFSNIATIRNFNSDLLQALKNAPSLKIFLQSFIERFYLNHPYKRAPYLKVYIDYINNFEN